MGREGVRFEWAVPAELSMVASDPGQAGEHPAIAQALAKEAARLGLDPSRVRIRGVKLATAGPIILAEATPT